MKEFQWEKQNIDAENIQQSTICWRKHSRYFGFLWQIESQQFQDESRWRYLEAFIYLTVMLNMQTSSF